MSEGVAAPPSTRGPATAGALLRQARQAQGLHIAALAAAMKVTQRKLEALEADRFDELLDATFVRALAQGVCRTLKIDAAPVLALLPPPNGHRLEQVAEGLNTPFRERPGRLVPDEWARLSTPAFWGVALLLVAAGLVYALPSGWWAVPGAMGSKTEPKVAIGNDNTASLATDKAPMSVAPPDNTASSSAEALPRVQEAPDAPANAAVTALAPAPASAAAPTSSAAVQFRTTADSWVEVVDAGGKLLISRTIKAGEDVGLDGVMPMKVKIGNVQAIAMTVRGQPTPLAPYTRDNIARFELK